jgi:hypothetical protein
MKTRTGTALLMAITILALAAALLAGSSATSRALMRKEISAERAASTAAALQVAVASIASQWTPGNDSLPPGTIALRDTTIGDIQVHLRLQALSKGRFLMVASATARSDSIIMAQRKITILLERPLQVDSAASSPSPRPIAHWALNDIY